MIVVVPAVAADAGEILTVQLAGFVTESRALGEADIPPLRDTVADVAKAVAGGEVFVARDLSAPLPGRIIGTVRLEDRPGCGYLGRLAVAPDRRGEGVGGLLIDAAAAAARGRFARIELVTARRSARNVAMYARRGWTELPAGPGTGRDAVDDVGIELVWMSRAVAPEPLRIRELRPAADAAVVAELWAAATVARWQRGGLGPEHDPGRLVGEGSSVASRPGVFGVLVEQAGRPVAVALAAPALTGDGVGPDTVPGVVHVSAVCADPVVWGRGAATAAVTAVLAAAGGRGFDRAQLVVDPANTRAGELYRRLGFVREEGWTATGRSGATQQRWSRPVRGG